MGKSSDFVKPVTEAMRRRCATPTADTWNGDTEPQRKPCRGSRPRWPGGRIDCLWIPYFPLLFRSAGQSGGRRHRGLARSQPHRRHLFRPSDLWAETAAPGDLRTSVAAGDCNRDTSQIRRGLVLRDDVQLATPGALAHCRSTVLGDWHCRLARGLVSFMSTMRCQPPRE